MAASLSPTLASRPRGGRPPAVLLGFPDQRIQHEEKEADYTTSKIGGLPVQKASNFQLKVKF